MRNVCEVANDKELRVTRHAQIGLNHDPSAPIQIGPCLIGQDASQSGRFHSGCPEHCVGREMFVLGACSERDPSGLYLGDHRARPYLHTQPL